MNFITKGLGRYLENEEKQGCHSLTRHSALACSIILTSIITKFRTVAELCSGNEILTPIRQIANRRPSSFKKPEYLL